MLCILEMKGSWDILNEPCDHDSWMGASAVVRQDISWNMSQMNELRYMFWQSLHILKKSHAAYITDEGVISNDISNDISNETFLILYRMRMRTHILYTMRMSSISNDISNETFLILNRMRNVTHSHSIYNSFSFYIECAFSFSFYIEWEWETWRTTCGWQRRLHRQLYNARYFFACITEMISRNIYLRWMSHVL